MSKVCHSFGCIGCAAEKVARKADRATPASFNKVALMTGESNSDEVSVIPRLQIALVLLHNLDENPLIHDQSH